jgi:hypothetical protein
MNRAKSALSAEPSVNGEKKARRTGGEKKTNPSSNGNRGTGTAAAKKVLSAEKKTEPSSNGDSRDGQGKFVKGNAGGPGNPFARQTAALRSAILRFMTPEKIEELVKVIYEQALQGDMRAAKLILSYAVGQPRPAVDPDRLDLEEMDLFGKQARTPEEFDRILYSPTARMMCMLLQTMVPGFEKEALGKLAAGIQELDERDRMRAGGAGHAARSQAEPGNEKRAPSGNGNVRERPTSSPDGKPKVSSRPVETEVPRVARTDGGTAEASDRVTKAAGDVPANAAGRQGSSSSVRERRTDKQTSPSSNGLFRGRELGGAA